ncbi:MAG: hypothetical protein VW362_05165 [Candidatus Nanopelagicales bacterium]
MGRLIDVAWQDAEDDPDIDPWTTYGTGRISAMGEPDGRGMVELEVSDESWRGRRSSAFTPDAASLSTTQNTTQLWPPGVKGAWRGMPATQKAAGSVINFIGSTTLYRIRMVATGQPRQPSTEVSEKLYRWVQNDVIENPSLGGDVPTSGNFRLLRLNYAGTDYEVVSFGFTVAYDVDPDIPTYPYGEEGLVPPGLGATVSNPDVPRPTVTLHAWIVAASAPPASGNAYLHAPAAPPSEDLPIHVGLDWNGHDWGTNGGWIHMADLTGRYWDAIGVDYDSTALTASEADLSIPALAPRITDETDNEWQWFEDQVWGPCMHIVLRNAQGQLLLSDLRLPDGDTVDPDALTVLDASNTNAMSWSLVGREVVTELTYRYLSVIPAIKGELESASLDGLVYTKVDGDPYLADAQALSVSGRRGASFDMFSVLEPTSDWYRRDQVIRSGSGSVFTQVAPEMAAGMFDIFRDGAWRISLEIDGSVTVAEGDLFVLDMASIKAANPDTQSRTGLRLVRVLSLEEHPTHYRADLIDLGSKLAPLAAPTLVVSQDSDRHLVVTISGTPAGAEVSVEVGYTATTSAPTVWQERRTGLSDGAEIFRDPPRSGYAHVRARSRAPSRIRSAWNTAYPMPLVQDPGMVTLSITVDSDGVPTVTGTANSATAGVRLRWVLHDQGVTPTFPAEV